MQNPNESIPFRMSINSPIVKTDDLQFHYDNEDFGEVPTIEQEDLADVRDDVDLSSLGVANTAADLELQSIAVPDDVQVFRSASIEELIRTVNQDESVDDEIVEDVLAASRQRRRQATRDFNRRRCFSLAIFTALSISLALAVIISSSSINKKSEIETKIQSESSANKFNEENSSARNPTHDLIAEPVINTQLELEVPFPVILGNNFIDLEEGFYNRETDLPFFWQVPLSGSSAQSIMTGCLNLVLASSMGDLNNSYPENLEVVPVGNQEYVDVNLGQPKGIEHAHNLGLASSGLADVVVSHHLHYAGKQIFEPEHRARAFTILRHPIERAVSVYHALVRNSQDEEIKSMTLSTYLDSEYAESNWLTRFLVNHRHDELGDEYINVAKEVLRRKFLIGIYDRIEESMSRFEIYFGWTITSPPGRVEACKVCIETMISNTQARDYDELTFINDNAVKGSSNYLRLKELNKDDIEVYWYAVGLYQEQRPFIEDLAQRVEP